jgi:hypothetical protein
MEEVFVLWRVLRQPPSGSELGQPDHPTQFRHRRLPHCSYLTAVTRTMFFVTVLDDAARSDQAGRTLPICQWAIDAVP